VESYCTERERLLGTAEPGETAARRLCDVTDEAVRELARTASSHLRGHWGIAALGGWGAGALLPSSDLDLLVLSDEPSGALRPFVEAVLYPLWDAGLSVGHQVRSRREQLRATRDDLITCTASLTARCLAGDCGWVDGILIECASDAHKRSRKLYAKLAERPRPGSAYALEPDLKEDAGGRRDFDELIWTAAIASGATSVSPQPLVGAGLATQSEVDAALRAAEVISAARWELGVSGYGQRMTLDAAQSLLTVDPAVVQLSLAETALVLSRVRMRAGGVRASGDSPLSAAELFRMLDAGDAALGELELAAQSGRLDELSPGFRELMTLRRPGLGHRLTVGSHSLVAAASLASPPTETALARSYNATGDLRTVQAAALTHDVGKREPGTGHAERGAAPARELAGRLGLGSEAAHNAGELVRLHLELVETATRIDPDDEDAVLAAAARIGNRDLLAPLHLLTAADSRATGPSTWSPWTATLVGALVSRLDAALSDEVDGAGIAARGTSVRVEALARMSAAGTAPSELGFVNRAPLRYLASREPEQVIRHARLVFELEHASSAEAARIAVSPGLAPDTWAVTVAAVDRPELLARIAGAMALSGLDILALDAYGSSGRVALDTFVVTSATLRPVTTETFAAFERLLSAALRDRLELRTRLAERRRHYPASQRGRATAEILSAGWDTAVLVTAPDRPGLLHDLARAVSSAGLDIRWAKVVTVDGMALDTFHVVGPDGGPVDDPGTLGHLAMHLREVR
jgi:[protein-PII] uridylyltransferase